ncbi:MAG: sulfatase/phosphatase domain-containing protein, partial [Dehalococcoidia bacterium]
PDEAVKHIDEIGGPHSHTNYPWGWAQCGNSPFKWYKQNTHEGGVHVPMVIHWPEGLGREQQGAKRDQFIYVADIVPTIYELVGVTPPEVFKGIEQLPVTGHSFAPILADPGHPPTNTLQYFEMAGSRALVADGWKAVCRHMPRADYDTEPWELYHLDEDPSECNDLADEYPQKLAELIELWWGEAERHGVLPLDDRGTELFGHRYRDHSPHPANRRYLYRPPMSPIPSATAAPAGRGAFDLTARITRGEGDEGVLWATGNENSGLSVFVQDDRLVADYNAFGAHTILESGADVPAGESTLGLRLRRTDRSSGYVELTVDGDVAGRAELPLYMRMISSVGASVGYDHGSAVSERYEAPFAFTGTLHEVVIELPAPAADDAASAARSEMSRQ